MGHRSNTLYAQRIESLPVPETKWPKWIVTGGGAGLLKPAPGSWGTIPAATVYGFLLLFQVAEPWRSIVLAIGAAISAVLLIAYGRWACAYFRRPDPGQVVLDEFAGFFITALFIPVPGSIVSGGFWPIFGFVSVLYVLFRATDTLKIPPGRQLEQLPWGWGILLDDVAAGVQANLIAQIVIRYFWM